MDIVRKADGSGQLAARPVGSGMKRGGFTKVTGIIKQEFAKYYVELGPDANPLVIMSKLSLDEKLDPAVRLAAASKLASFLVPKRFAVSADEDEDSAKVAFFQRFSAMITGALPDRPAVALIEGETDAQ